MNAHEIITLIALAGAVGFGGARLSDDTALDALVFIVFVIAVISGAGAIALAN